MKKQRIVSVFLVIAILITLNSTAYAVEFAGNQTRALWSPTGDYPYDMVGQARAELGNNGSKYRAFGGLGSNQPWCAAFVSWCAREVGVSTGDIVTHNACSTLYQRSTGVKYLSARNGGSYTPKLGDIIFFCDYPPDVDNIQGPNDSDLYNAFTHVGIVTRATDSRVYTIEGNNNARVSEDDYPLGSSYIGAYISPHYRGAAHNWVLTGTLYSCSLCGRTTTSPDDVMRVEDLGCDQE